MNSNEQIINRFYTSFAGKDYQAMQNCYADEVIFSDNAFPNLKGKQAKAMWHMLVNASKDMQITFSNVKADEKTGLADWVATYSFSLTGRKVINKVHADFEFSNGKIIKHTDTFDFWKWASQAFGLTGRLLGWTPYFRKKLHTTTKERLQAFIDNHPEYK